MKVTVFGSNGLLSSHIGIFCNENKYELDIFGLEEPKLHQYNNFYKINLLKDEIDYNLIKDSDLVIYSVGAGIQSNLNENSDLIYKLNVLIPISISNHLNNIDFKGRFVTFGSFWEIGANCVDECFSENEILESQLKVYNDYTISKRLFTRFVSSYNSKFTFWHFILPTIYGEFEQEHRLIPYVLKSIENNSELSFTSGEQIRQYIYINDVINIIFNCIESNLNNGIYNIAGVEELSVKELVIKLFELKRKQVPENIFGKTIRNDAEMKILRLNGDKLNKKINYRPHIKLYDVYDKYIFS